MTKRRRPSPCLRRSASEGKGGRGCRATRPPHSMYCCPGSSPRFIGRYGSELYRVLALQWNIPPTHSRLSDTQGPANIQRPFKSIPALFLSRWWLMPSRPPGLPPAIYTKSHPWISSPTIQCSKKKKRNCNLIKKARRVHLTKDQWRHWTSPAPPPKKKFQLK
jgi:hypothetical protein